MRPASDGFPEAASVPSTACTVLFLSLLSYPFKFEVSQNEIINSAVRPIFTPAETFVGEDNLPLRGLKNSSRNRCREFLSRNNASQVSARTFFSGLFNVVSGTVAYIDSWTGTDISYFRVSSTAPHDKSTDSTSNLQNSLLRVTWRRLFWRLEVLSVDLSCGAVEETRK